MLSARKTYIAANKMTEERNLDSLDMNVRKRCQRS